MVQRVGGSDVSQWSVNESNVELKVVPASGNVLCPRGV
jgi:hypothetical protein